MVEAFSFLSRRATIKGRVIYIKVIDVMNIWDKISVSVAVCLSVFLSLSLSICPTLCLKFIPSISGIYILLLLLRFVPFYFLYRFVLSTRDQLIQYVFLHTRM